MTQLTSTKDSALFIKNGEELVGIVYLDQKTHHNVFFKVEEMGSEQISDLFKETV